MKAIVQDEYGSPDVLELRDIDMPAWGDNDVLVRVHAAGVGAAAWHLMAGLPYVVRVSGYGFRGPKIQVPGTDLAGVVDAVGEKVTRFQLGDEVFGEGEGTYAEYACAPEEKLVSKPANLTFEQAAAVVDSGHTALQGLRDVGEVEAGGKVLIIGAGGGVGRAGQPLFDGRGGRVGGAGSGPNRRVRTLSQATIRPGVAA